MGRVAAALHRCIDLAFAPYAAAVRACCGRLIVEEDLASARGAKGDGEGPLQRRARLSNLLLFALASIRSGSMAYRALARKVLLLEGLSARNDLRGTRGGAVVGSSVEEDGERCHMLIDALLGITTAIAVVAILREKSRAPSVAAAAGALGGAPLPHRRLSPDLHPVADGVASRL